MELSTEDTNLMANENCATTSDTLDYGQKLNTMKQFKATEEDTDIANEKLLHHRGLHIFGPLHQCTIDAPTEAPSAIFEDMSKTAKKRLKWYGHSLYPMALLKQFFRAQWKEPGGEGEVRKWNGITQEWTEKPIVETRALADDWVKWSRLVHISTE
ncbi:hypothetical protein PoB_002152900 [Plakobranchus ocellatus]|uniref:Uncharacterized protein n=1 Tax=Plakobranchus ocellatus TaxID=259542 RepID=A0AAV3ZI80_9GAST|nr:hypothetical protein PoB_002152900 [Plakobranchus ocellatus]